MEKNSNKVEEELHIEKSTEEKEKIEENIQEKRDNTTEIKEEDKTESKNNLAEAATPPPKDELVSKVDNIKEEVETIYNEYKKILDNFEKESLELAKQENEILNSTVKKTVEYLEAIKVPNLNRIDNIINEIKLDNKKEILEVKYPSKGRFKGFFLGTLTTIASVAGLGIYGAKIANLPLNLATFSQKTNLDTIASKYLELLNLKDMPVMNGYFILGAASLILGFIVYKIVTITQKFKNKKMVENLENSAKDFKEELLKQIEELQKIIEHIEKIKEVNKKYDVILQEQNAKINRMLFIEEPKEFNDLHANSQLEVEKTQLILDELLKLMNTPVVENDKLSENSITNLKSANIVINEIIRKLY